MNDKQKGNTQDYMREMSKAVQQLVTCSQEDPKDLEALGYLGWAYAELDSAKEAGDAFKKAIDGLTAKGDVKTRDLVTNNRDSYYARYFNAGIERISAAQTAYPDMTKKPESPTDTAMQAEAKKAYDTALTNLRKALYLRPGDARTYHNLGAVYTFMGDYDNAEKTFKEGLSFAPQDSVLLRDLSTVGVGTVQRMIEAKNYDGAIAMLQPMVTKEPGNASLHGILADAYFRKAQEAKGDDRAKSFVAAAWPSTKRPDMP